MRQRPDDHGLFEAFEALRSADTECVTPPVLRERVLDEWDAHHAPRAGADETQRPPSRLAWTRVAAIAATLAIAVTAGMMRRQSEPRVDAGSPRAESTTALHEETEMAPHVLAVPRAEPLTSPRPRMVSRRARPAEPTPAVAALLDAIDNALDEPLTMVRMRVPISAITFPVDDVPLSAATVDVEFVLGEDGVPRSMRVMR